MAVSVGGFGVTVLGFRVTVAAIPNLELTPHVRIPGGGGNRAIAELQRFVIFSSPN